MLLGLAMKFSPDDVSALVTVSAYGPEGIVVKGERYAGSLILSARGLVTDWNAQTLDGLDQATMLRLLEMRPEPLLIGTGVRQIFPAPWVYELAQGQAVGIEVMDTAAACRTYNVLVAEGRRAVAVLLPIRPVT